MKIPRKIIHAFVSCLSMLAVLGTVNPANAQAEAKDGASPTRSRAESGEIKPCIECHEGYYGITKTKHAIKGDSRTPMAKGTSLTGNPEDAMCGSCHGDLSEHLKTPRKPGLVPTVFGSKAPSEPQNEACLIDPAVMYLNNSTSPPDWEDGNDRHENAVARCAA
jgi:cytochrome c553